MILITYYLEALHKLLVKLQPIVARFLFPGK